MTPEEHVNAFIEEMGKVEYGHDSTGLIRPKKVHIRILRYHFINIIESYDDLELWKIFSRRGGIADNATLKLGNTLFCATSTYLFPSPYMYEDEYILNYGKYEALLQTALLCRGKINFSKMSSIAFPPNVSFSWNFDPSLKRHAIKKAQFSENNEMITKIVMPKADYPPECLVCFYTYRSTTEDDYKVARDYHTKIYRGTKINCGGAPQPQPQPQPQAQPETEIKTETQTETQTDHDPQPPAYSAPPQLPTYIVSGSWYL